MKKIAFSMKIDKELLDKVKERAKKEFRTIGLQIELILKEYIEKDTKK